MDDECWCHNMAPWVTTEDGFAYFLFVTLDNWVSTVKRMRP